MLSVIQTLFIYTPIDVDNKIIVVIQFDMLSNAIKSFHTCIQSV